MRTKEAPSPSSVLFAKTLADSYADMGLFEYNKLAHRFYAPPAGRESNFFDWMSQSLPTATLLAFSAELYLKVMLLQREPVFVRKHELRDLFDLLPDDCKQRNRDRFDVEMNKSLRIMTIRFEKTPRHGGPANSNPAPAALSIDEALSTANDLFVKTRYFYESAASVPTEIDFRSLIFPINAFREEIGKFDGAVTITTSHKPSASTPT